jgi:hypothetical protein
MSFSQFSGRSLNFYNLFSVLTAQQPAGPSTYYLQTVGNNGPSLLMNGSGGPLLLQFGVDIPISPAGLDTKQYPVLEGYPPIVGPLLGNLFPSDEPPIQQTSPVQQTAPEVEYVEEPPPAPKSKRSTKKGGAAIWTRYLS